jgi:hypothetical protein
MSLAERMVEAAARASVAFAYNDTLATDDDAFALWCANNPDLWRQELRCGRAHRRPRGGGGGGGWDVRGAGESAASVRASRRTPTRRRLELLPRSHARREGIVL